MPATKHVTESVAASAHVVLRPGMAEELKQLPLAQSLTLTGVVHVLLRKALDAEKKDAP